MLEMQCKAQPALGMIQYNTPTAPANIAPGAQQSTADTVDFTSSVKTAGQSQTLGTQAQTQLVHQRHPLSELPNGSAGVGVTSSSHNTSPRRAGLCNLLSNQQQHALNQPRAGSGSATAVEQQQQRHPLLELPNGSAGVGTTSSSHNMSPGRSGLCNLLSSQQQHSLNQPNAGSGSETALKQQRQRHPLLEVPNDSACIGTTSSGNDMSPQRSSMCNLLSSQQQHSLNQQSAGSGSPAVLEQQQHGLQNNSTTLRQMPCHLSAMQICGAGSIGDTAQTAQSMQSNDKTASPTANAATEYQQQQQSLNSYNAADQAPYIVKARDLNTSENEFGQASAVSTDAVHSRAGKQSHSATQAMANSHSDSDKDTLVNAVDRQTDQRYTLLRPGPSQECRSNTEGDILASAVNRQTGKPYTVLHPGPHHECRLHTDWSQHLGAVGASQERRLNTDWGQHSGAGSAVDLFCMVSDKGSQDSPILQSIAPDADYDSPQGFAPTLTDTLRTVSLLAPHADIDTPSDAAAAQSGASGVKGLSLPGSVSCSISPVPMDARQCTPAIVRLSAPGSDSCSISPASTNARQCTPSPAADLTVSCTVGCPPLSTISDPMHFSMNKFFVCSIRRLVSCHKQDLGQASSCLQLVISYI